MKQFISLVMGFAIGVVMIRVIVTCALNASPGFINGVVTNQCSESSHFSDGGICIPKGEFVAVVRDGDGDKTLVWGEENINKLRQSPAQSSLPDKQ